MRVILIMILALASTAARAQSMPEGYEERMRETRMRDEMLDMQWRQEQMQRQQEETQRQLESARHDLDNARMENGY